jgi:hypothetical protein
VPRVFRLIAACAFASVIALLPAAEASAAGWLPLAGAAKGNAGNAVSSPSVAVDDAGNVYVAWIENSFLEVSKRPVGGVFEQPQTLDAAATSSDPDIGVDGAGNAVVVWTEVLQSGGTGIRQARRAAGASGFGTPTDVPTAGVASLPSVAVNRAGEAVLAVKRVSGSDQFARLFVATSTTDFSSFVDYGGPNNFVSQPVVAIDEAGDAVAAWVSGNSVINIDSAYRPAGKPFGALQNVRAASPPGPKDPSVAVDSQGNAVALWDEGDSTLISAAARPAGDTTPWNRLLPNPDSGPGSIAGGVGFDLDRNAVGAWAAGGALKSSVRPPAPGAVFPPPQSLTDTAEEPEGIGVDSGIQGTTALIWQGAPGTLNHSVVEAAVRPNAGSFGSLATLSPAGHGGDSPDIAVDPKGNVAVAWVDSNPPDANTQIVTAEYDVTTPTLTSPQVPAAGTTGESVAMSVTAADDWSQPFVGWNFGDGGIGFGGSVTHTYDAPGTYNVSATAIDGGGNTTATNGTIVVSDPVPPVDTPTRGVDFNASSVSGTVLVSVPKNAPAGRVLARPPVAHSAAATTPPAGYTPFRLLGKDDNIPVGSILDASRGISSITMAANPGGTQTQKGQFSKGVFRTKQTKASPLTTAVMLGGGNFKRDCRRPRARAGSAGATAARRRPARRLFANVKGRFRTRGRHSTATVRGTQYLVKDSCSGTTTRVVKGSVVVRDLVKHRSRVVRAGHRYVAKPRPLRTR